MDPPPDVRPSPGPPWADDTPKHSASELVREIERTNGQVPEHQVAALADETKKSAVHELSGKESETRFANPCLGSFLEGFQAGKGSRRLLLQKFTNPTFSLFVLPEQ